MKYRLRPQRIIAAGNSENFISSRASPVAALTPTKNGVSAYVTQSRTVYVAEIMHNAKATTEKIHLIKM